MGFSKSMPDHAIREHLRAAGVQYTEPSMATTFEVIILHFYFISIVNPPLKRVLQDLQDCTISLLVILIIFVFL